MLEDEMSPEHWALVRNYLLGKACRAANHLPTFHEFVQRDEATQQRIVLAPYQELVFDFMETFGQCVLMLPPGFAKTNMVMSRTLWRIGHDPTRRAMYLTKDDTKARNFITTIKNYIESSSELRLVFPNLKPTERSSEPWTQSALTVDRPLGIKDPTLSAASEKTGVAGYRLSDLIVDDVLDEMNTRTKDGRDKMWRKHEDVLTHRLDQSADKRGDTRFVVMNTAWDNDDYLHRLMDSDPDKYGNGWPALLIDVYGNVAVRNVPTERWDPRALRPARSNLSADGVVLNSEGPFRVSAADDAYAAETGDDPDRAPLWWPRITHDLIEQKRVKSTAVSFNQAYRLMCRSEETAKCKMSWIDACIDLGRRGDEKCEPHHSMIAASIENPYRTANPVIMGVDLAFGVGDKHDSNSLCTLEVLEDGRFKLLDMLTMQCANATFLRDIIYTKAMSYENCQVMVESVGAQKMMVEMLKEKGGASFRVLSFNTTGAGATGKWEIATGVESVFLLIMNTGLIIPCRPGGRVHPEIRKLIDACIYYLPSAHTPDELMALWFAVNRGRRLHAWAQQAKGQGSSMLGATSR